MGLHVKVETDGLLRKLIKRPFVLAAILAIEDDVDGSFSLPLLVHEFEDLLGLFNVTENELSRHSPKEEKLRKVRKKTGCCDSSGQILFEVLTIRWFLLVGRFRYQLF